MGTSSLQIMEDGQFYACHQDEQGSTIYITGRDEAVENCYVYDAFGNSMEKKEGIQNRIQYTGQQYDQETGQYYLRARYYNPAIGRFTQEDTYRGDGLNLYAYCKNNPVVYYDPSGHDQLVNPSNGTEMTNTAGVENRNLVNSSADAKISSGQSSGKSTDFYVTPNGDVVPATAYRYMNSKYAEQTMESMSAPGSYFGFEKFDSASDAMDAFQISPKWNDCKLRGEFDTLQVIDEMYVPLEYNGKGPDLEPFTRCYPEYGKGGSQQFVYDGVIHFENVDIIDD